MRRRTWLLLVTLAAVVPACSSDSDGSKGVQVGPGSSEVAPAAAILDEPPGDEPTWLDSVPPPAEPAAARGKRAAALGLAASAALEAPPSESPDDATSTTVAEDPEYPFGDFSGTMTIDIAYYNYCVTYDGYLAYAGEGTYESDVEVSINEQAGHDGVTERSPFNLLVTSEPGVEGSIVVWSAQVMYDPSDQRSALFDYWHIDEDAGEITGTLTDRWPGVAFNKITTAQPLVPCSPGFTLALPDDIAEGAQLTGTVSEDAVDLEILGQSLDREVRFRARVHAEPTES
jgi:hypothetical protein